MQIPDQWFSLLLWLLFEEGLWRVWMSSPLWWAVLKVLLRRDRLPRPATFVVVSAALAYGVIAAVSVVVIIPVKVAGFYLAPQFMEAGLPLGATLTALDNGVTAALLPLAFSLPISAWWISRRLAQRWPRLCGGDVASG
ncbi:TPA: hypothetical protein QDZ10_001628 [Stenotrophomonas maltophilia]|nr:hypothetical protein [Stenotrophomonas maltophilia]